MNVTKDHSANRWVIDGDRQGLRFRFDVDGDGNLVSHQIIVKQDVVPPAFRKGCCGGDSIDDIVGD